MLFLLFYLSLNCIFSHLLYVEKQQSTVKAVKEIVHPKNENSVIIYSPSSSSKPVWISLFCRTQGRYLKKVWKVCFGAPLTSIGGKKILWSQWCPELLCFPHLQISSFVFSRTKTLIQVWNYLRVSKWWQIFIFGWTIPLSPISGQVNMINLCQKDQISGS